MVDIYAAQDSDWFAGLLWQHDERLVSFGRESVDGFPTFLDLTSVSWR